MRTTRTPRASGSSSGNEPTAEKTHRGLSRTTRLEEEHPKMEMNERAPRTPAHGGLSTVRVGVLLAVGLLVFLAVLIISRDGDNSSAPTPAAGSATAASPADLRAFAGSVDHPVYWAGTRTDRKYELTRTDDGRVYIRYLPAAAQPGDRRAKFLTIGTYPRASAFTELKRAAKAKGAVSVPLGRGGLMVFSEARPTSVYFGYPKGRYQVEVYDPSPAVARQLVLSGEVRPIR